MRTVECGEIRTSVLGFGCGSVMGRVGCTDSLRAMNAAWEAGITLFDTARSYGYGEAEGLLGEFLAGRRAQATVVTKFGILPSAPSRWKRLAKPVVRGVLGVLPQARGLVRRGVAGEMSAGHFDVATLRRSLEDSLRQLRTDYVDILLAHEAPASVMAQEDLMAELAAIVDAGKARRVGLACTSQVAAVSMASIPHLVSAFQAPVTLFENSFGSNKDSNLFKMANHPFGGTTGVRRVQAILRKMSADIAVDAPLRKKLNDAGEGRLAEIVFANALQVATVVMPSMMQIEHLRANIAAVESGRWPAVELDQIRQYLSVCLAAGIS